MKYKYCLALLTTILLLDSYYVKACDYDLESLSSNHNSSGSNKLKEAWEQIKLGTGQLVVGTGIVGATWYFQVQEDSDIARCDDYAIGRDLNDPYQATLMCDNRCLEPLVQKARQQYNMNFAGYITPTNVAYAIGETLVVNGTYNYSFGIIKFLKTIYSEYISKELFEKKNS